MASKNLKEIPLAALREGMTVVKLDISWLDSPFLTHTRRIRGFKDIEALKDAGVKQVVIDLDKSPKFGPQDIEQASRSHANDANERDEATSESKPPDPPLTKTQASSSSMPGQKTSVKQELHQAVEIRRQVKDAVDDLQKSFESGTPIKSAQLTPLVDSTLESLERNNQALLSLVHLSRKSQKLADHTFGCFCLVLNLALHRGVEPIEREQLGLAALLHEAGWVQIPLQLMGKRKTYSYTEKKLVQNHIQLAEKILSQSDIPPLTLRLVAEHHERLDGSGYPKGLKGDQIHPLSQLLAVVDTYEERVHQLTDAPGMIPTNAMRSIYVDSEHGLYDTEVAAAFISLLGIYPVMSAVKLNTGEVGLIREIHDEAPLAPSVEIHYDCAGKSLTPATYVDLRDRGDEKRAIECAVDPHDSALDWACRLLPEEADIA